MRKFMVLLAVLCSSHLYSQDIEKPNINYFKVLILDESDKLLLVEFKGVWEPIGGSYNTTESMEDYVRELSLTANVQATDIRLRGLFSAYYNKSAKPMVYHYYTVRYLSGEIKTPAGCTGVKWVDLDEAREIMVYPDMLKVYEKALENDNLWGGSYQVVKDAKRGTREVTQLVEFFKLN